MGRVSHGSRTPIPNTRGGEGAPALSGREELIRDVQKILSSEPRTPGEDLLPSYATADPGALVYRLHEQWSSNAPSRGKADSHTAKNLKKWLKPIGSIKSLEHKLAGRRPHTTKEEATRLLTVLLEHWGVNAEGESESFPNLGLTPADAAQKLANVIFGPIYSVRRKRIRIAPSPGINPATFMQSISNKDACLIPVLDRAMYGDSPIQSLHGAGITLSRCLCTGKLSIVYVLESRAPRQGLEYVQYLYERSFLVSLFQLLRTWAEKGWQPALPKWEKLQSRLFVCIAPPPGGQSNDLLVKDFLPTHPPLEWHEALASFDKHGFVVVGSGSNLEYWYFDKPDEKQESTPREERQRGRPADDDKSPLAFARLEAQVPDEMQAAHKMVVAAALEEKESQKKFKSNGWHFLTADAFMKNMDLEGKA